MIIDVVFEENEQRIDADFGEVQQVAADIPEWEGGEY